MKGLLTLIITFSLLLQGCSVFSTQDPRNNAQHWQDQRIEMDIAGLAHTRQYTKKLSINSIALDGTVLLVGQALNPAIKRQFVKQAQQIPHVDHIYDQIQIHPNLSVGEISQDAWLTTKIKSQLVASKQLTDVVIKVITENKHVYLLGYVSKKQGQIAANIARNVSGVKHVITLFEKPLIL